MSDMLLEADEPETLEAALSFLDAFELPDDPDFHVQTPDHATVEPATEPSVVVVQLPPAEKPTDVFVFGGAQGAALASQVQLAAKALANASNKNYARPRPRDFNPNRARDERREELLYLRTKVAEMESQLEELKKNDDSSKKSSRPASCSSIVTAGILKTASSVASRGVFDVSMPLLRGQIQPSGSIWEDVAMRQNAERQKAELENIRLRTLLEGQIKVAKGLEKLLNKRSNNQVSHAAAVCMVEHGESDRIAEGSAALRRWTSAHSPPSYAFASKRRRHFPAAHFRSRARRITCGLHLRSERVEPRRARFPRRQSAQ